MIADSAVKQVCNSTYLACMNQEHDGQLLHRHLDNTRLDSGRLTVRAKTL